MGNAAAFCVVVAALIAVTLTPAVLSWRVPRSCRRAVGSIDTPQKIAERRAGMPNAPRSRTAGCASCWRVRYRLWWVGTLALLAVAAPMSQMRLGLPDASNYPLR